jgi:hypothetical protein
MMKTAGTGGVLSKNCRLLRKWRWWLQRPPGVVQKLSVDGDGCICGPRADLRHGNCCDNTIYYFAIAIAAIVALAEKHGRKTKPVKRNN